MLIKDFDTCMYDYTLYRGRKLFCRYCLRAFSSKEILKSHIKYCYKTNDKKRIIMPKKDKYVNFKNYERQIKSLFIIYADLKAFSCQKKTRSKIQMNIILKNIKKKFLLVMVITEYVPMISLVSLFGHT